MEILQYYLFGMLSGTIYSRIFSSGHCTTLVPNYWQSIAPLTWDEGPGELEVYGAKCIMTVVPIARMAECCVNVVFTGQIDTTNVSSRSRHLKVQNETLSRSPFIIQSDKLNDTFVCCNIYSRTWIRFLGTLIVALWIVVSPV